MKRTLPLFLIAAAMLVSCGGSSSSSVTPAASSEASVAPASALYLDWVADNKIVIELFDVGEARFTYGNAALQASQTLDLAASAKLACSSTLTAADTFNFVFVTEAETATGFNSGAALYAGIEGDKLSDFLNDNNDLAGQKRAYIAISFGDTVKWTKNKNAAMDAKIQALIDASK
ncbi:MAG: hypothetical protein SPL80_02415 [Bacilli bacterium]|nr:hypothetical protein [Bacilli bacterium]